MEKGRHEKGRHEGVKRKDMKEQERKDETGKGQLLTLAGELRQHLEERLIPFWRGLRDVERGGYYGFMDSDLRIDRKAEKGSILNSRILWFFSNAYIRLQDQALLEEAEWGFRFLREACMDREHGGLFWSVDYKGQPLDTAKHTYNQAFAIYALSSFYEASGREEALETAKELFELVEDRCRDEKGYLESFNREFYPESNEKLSENGVVAGRTMNTLLHVMEAYTQLYRVWPDRQVRDRLVWIGDLIERKIYNPALCRQEVFFDMEYKSLLDLHSYGHDIETAWLLDRTLEVLEDEALKRRLYPVTEALTGQVYRTAFDGRSLANECERGVVEESRVWWVQAENVVGMINGYERTPQKTEYLEAALAQWDFIRTYVVDSREGSEWFWKVSPEGEPAEEKPVVEPWKCPYHNGRMCMEIMDRAGAGASNTDKTLAGKYRQGRMEQ